MSKLWALTRPQPARPCPNCGRQQRRIVVANIVDWHHTETKKPNCPKG